MEEKMLFLLFAKPSITERDPSSATFFRIGQKSNHLLKHQYEKNIAELKDKIVELRYDYDVLKGESILSNSKKSSVTESRSVIKNLEKSKKSIFSSIPSEESAWNFSFTNSDFNNLFDFLLNNPPDNTKSDILPANGFLISSLRAKFDSR